MDAPSPTQSSEVPWHGEVAIPAGGVTLEGILTVPDGANGLVIFAHGSGSSRHSSRNQHVARFLQSEGLATLLFDLLTTTEERADSATGHLRFDVVFLASRLRQATAWAQSEPRTAQLPRGYFGASTGAAAALIAAADPLLKIAAVVSRGGRPDLAGDVLPRVKSPTLLIVGGADTEVLALNEQALARLKCVKRLEIVPAATHLFEESGALQAVARFAADWFTNQLRTVPPPT